MNIIEITNQFPDELGAIKHFERIRWGKKPKCAYCGSENISVRNADHRFNCKNCKKSFSVTTNTHLHNTRLPFKNMALLFCNCDRCKEGSISQTA